MRIPQGGSIVSIGYEGRSLPELVDVLRTHRVEVLVDVRQTPISRKPGFSKRRLSEALVEAGIEYRHEPDLGNPKENRAGFKGGASPSARRRYLRHLNNGSRGAFEDVVHLALARRIALLCFERAEAECHRACIIEQAQAEHPALSAARL